MFESGAKIKQNKMNVFFRMSSTEDLLELKLKLVEKTNQQMHVRRLHHLRRRKRRRKTDLGHSGNADQQVRTGRKQDQCYDFGASSLFESLSFSSLRTSFSTKCLFIRPNNKEVSPFNPLGVLSVKGSVSSVCHKYQQI